jgi:hypothetical protein
VPAEPPDMAQCKLAKKDEACNVDTDCCPGLTCQYVILLGYYCE